MKRTNIYHIITLASTLLWGMTSCGNFLDELPDNRTELDSELKIAKLLVSAYPEATPNEIFELYSDNTDDNGPDFSYLQLSERDLYSWIDTNEEYQDTPHYLWASSYSAIAAANTALQAIEKMGNPSSLDPQRGEALVCRAYNHFVLANIFCQAYDSKASQNLGIPYMEDVETTVSPQYQRGTLEEVYQKIEQDLLAGIPLISDDSYSIPKYHFNKKAAYAFAARFYLYYTKADLSNYDKVIDYATRVVGNNPADVMRDWEAWSKVSANDNIQPDAYIASSNEANLLMNTTISSLGALCSAYMVGKRYLHNKDIASHETSQSPGLWGSSEYIYVKPFTTSGADFSIVRKVGIYGNFLYSVPVIFTTDETLLCRAEAYIHKKEYNLAAADLTAWMHAYTRSSLVLTPEKITAYYNNLEYYSPLTKKTPKKQLNPDFSIESGVQENMLHCLLHMRRIATLHEGLRWQDIKRYGITIFRRDIVNNRITDTMGPNDLRRAIQIPKSVILSGMQPNPRLNN